MQLGQGLKISRASNSHISTASHSQYQKGDYYKGGAPLGMYTDTTCHQHCTKPECIHVYTDAMKSWHL
jgi:hypothetical protein